MGAVLAAAGPAAADASLLSSSPSDGATVRSAPASVAFTFDEVVQARLATVTVTDGGGAAVGTPPPLVDRATVVQPLPATLGAGRYTVAYRIVSADGHPVTGRVRFTVGATQDAALPVPADPVVARQQAVGSDTGARTWPWVTAAAVALVCWTAVAVARQRRRTA